MVSSIPRSFFQVCHCFCHVYPPSFRMLIFRRRIRTTTSPSVFSSPPTPSTTASRTSATLILIETARFRRSPPSLEQASVTRLVSLAATSRHEDLLFGDAAGKQAEDMRFPMVNIGILWRMDSGRLQTSAAVEGTQTWASCEWGCHHPKTRGKTCVKPKEGRDCSQGLSRLALPSSSLSHPTLRSFESSEARLKVAKTGVLQGHLVTVLNPSRRAEEGQSSQW